MVDKFPSCVFCGEDSDIAFNDRIGFCENHPPPDSTGYWILDDGSILFTDEDNEAAAKIVTVSEIPRGALVGLAAAEAAEAFADKHPNGSPTGDDLANAWRQAREGRFLRGLPLDKSAFADFSEQVVGALNATRN